MRVLLFLLLAGCDIVLGLDKNAERPTFPLESDTHDEDMDGVADALDPCPHRAEYGADEFDGDSDGIGDRCDPRIDTADTRYFASYEGGRSVLLSPQGTAIEEADAVLLGTIDGDAQLVFGSLDVGVVDIEADVEIVRIKPLVAGEYTEVGIYSAHRGFDPKIRGDVCFYGSDLFVVGQPNFVEFNNDDDYIDNLRVRFDGPLPTRGQFSHARTSASLGCSFKIANGSHGNNGPHEDGARNLTGKVALSTHNMQVRFHYVWVVTPRL